MPKILCVTNQKGGVGKTTTSANLAGAFSEQGKKVLLIDLDPQAALTASLGLESVEFEKTIYNTLVDPDNFPLSSIIVKTSIPGVFLAPAIIDLSAADIDLYPVVGWDRLLRDAIWPLKDQFDYVVIDCPPSLGVLTTCALVTSYLVVIPVQAEYLALRGVAQLQKSIARVMKRSNPILQIRVLITMYDQRTKHAQEVVAEIQKVFGDKVSSIFIKRTIRFADSTIAGQPLILFDPTSEAAEAYRQFSKEIMNYD